MEAVGVAAAIPADRRYIPAVQAEVMEAEAANFNFFQCKMKNRSADDPKNE